MKSIITVTMNPAVDHNSSTDFVTDEKKLKCEQVRYDPGGGGINISRAINILGGKTKAFYPAGGCTGDLLESILDEEDLDHSRIDVAGLTRVNIHILETSTNRQYRFNMPGSAINESEWKKVLSIIADYAPNPDFIVASGSLPPELPFDFYAKLSELAKQKNSKFILDTSGEPLKKALDEGVYLIKPNLNEFTNLTGEELRNEDHIVTAAKKFIQKGKTEVVVISTGAAGTLYVSETEAHHIYAPLVPINSRIGAGDCMVAGITLKLAMDESLDQAIRYGVAAGTAAVMTSGTKLCRKEDTERLFNELVEKTYEGS